MEALNATDVAIGWSLIAIIATGFIFGAPYLLKLAIRSTSAALEQERRRRELEQERLDDQFRDEMFAWAERQE